MKHDSDQRESSAVADGGTESLNVFADTAVETGQVANELSNGEATETDREAKREFLLEAIRRAPILRTLRTGSADATDLSEAVDVSRSTIHRAINTLEDYDIVTSVNDEYELTTLGEVIAKETAAFGSRAWTTVSLKQFLNSINMSAETVPVEYFADATITRRRSRQPHETIHRIIKLIEDSDRLQMLSTVISPVYVDVGYREMMDGMEIEAVFEREVLEIMLSEYPEKAQETIATGNFDVYAQDRLPFELFIFDDEVGMAAHNENGNAEVLVECDDPSAIGWAKDLYSRYRSEAEPLMNSQT